MLKFWEYPMGFKDPASIYAYFLFSTHHDIMWYLIIILILVYWSLYKILRDFSWKVFNKQEGVLLYFMNYNFKFIEVNCIYYITKGFQYIVKELGLVVYDLEQFYKIVLASSKRDKILLILVKIIVKVLNLIFGLTYRKSYYHEDQEQDNDYVTYDLINLDGKSLTWDEEWLINPDYKNAILLEFSEWEFTKNDILDIIDERYVAYRLNHYTVNGFFFVGRRNVNHFLSRRSRSYNDLTTLGLEALLPFSRVDKLLLINSGANLNDEDSVMRDSLFEAYEFKHSFSFEVIWGIFPLSIIGFILVPSLYLLYSLDEDIDPKYTIKVIGHQWYWSYEFNNWVEVSQDNFKYINFAYNSYLVDVDSLEFGTKRLLEVDKRLVVPINIPLRFLITSGDVLHSWAIPELGIKIDAVPGRLNQFLVFINCPGVFYGQCSELCGVDHGAMPIVVQGVPYINFVKWLKESEFY